MFVAQKMKRENRCCKISSIEEGNGKRGKRTYSVDVSKIIGCMMKMRQTGRKTLQRTVRKNTSNKTGWQRWCCWGRVLAYLSLQPGFDSRQSHKLYGSGLVLSQNGLEKLIRNRGILEKNKFNIQRKNLNAL